MNKRIVLACHLFMVCALVFLPPLAAQNVPDVSSNDTAIVAAARTTLNWWMPRHHGVIATQKPNQKIIFIGDSITHWFDRSPGIWNWTLLSKQYDRRITNLGFGGDLTQHVIWRLNNGEFPAGINPEYVVLMIGTNNRQAPESIAAGIWEIIKIIDTKSPGTKIILMSLLPRGTGLTDVNTIRNYLVNDIISGYDGYLNVKYLDITEHYVNPDGTLKAELFSDRLHPNMAGYNFWREAIIAEVGS